MKGKRVASRVLHSFHVHSTVDQHAIVHIVRTKLVMERTHQEREKNQDLHITFLSIDPTKRIENFVI